MKLRTESTGVLVVGSGIAGLFFALHAAEYADVTIITKKERAESNTNYAQGGIAAVLNAHDTVESHIADTLNSGAGLCRLPAVECVVTEGPERVRDLVALGTHFTRSHGKLDLGREGGHSANRIVHAQDVTGREVERSLLARVTAHPRITVHEHVAALDLIADRSGCSGAIALDVITGRTVRFRARAVLLATGGCGQAYLHTTNPEIATGDGVAMAFRAGARIANMEFIQFHPTTLYHPRGKSFLISEAVRGFGGVLRTGDGKAFMKEYDERADLAPRDIVARAIDAEMKRRGDECVFLDVTHIPPSRVRSHFPNIYRRCRELGVTITKEWIPVVPAAHYMCGGVQADLDARTSIPRLFAVGEVACTGLHGANRLASNSLLEAIVFARRAAECIRPLVTRGPAPRAGSASVRLGTRALTADEEVLIAGQRREIREAMWDYVGIVRSDLRLERARRRIALVRDEVETLATTVYPNAALSESRDMAHTAMLIVASAAHRTESRGLHFTSDHRRRDDRRWRHDTVLVRRGAGVRFIESGGLDQRAV